MFSYGLPSFIPSLLTDLTRNDTKHHTLNRFLCMYLPPCIATYNPCMYIQTVLVCIDTRDIHITYTRSLQGSNPLKLPESIHLTRGGAAMFPSRTDLIEGAARWRGGAVTLATWHAASRHAISFSTDADCVLSLPVLPRMGSSNPNSCPKVTCQAGCSL